VITSFTEEIPGRMAADKKTFIRNAQKQVQKGQLDRAIASYKAILKIDDKDEKVHNALGDLYIRKNMKGEGIKEYLWVANYYEKDGFHLRSIAICQKILNLDPQLAAVRLKLADLYSHTTARERLRRPWRSSGRLRTWTRTTSR
jgi:tetratricopeptide (TPR) repeat protein